MSLRILLVEDEALIAMMAQDMIEALGHEIVRTAATLADAHAALDSTTFDLALLDVNLNGDSSLAIAHRLVERGCPFAFTTGYGAAGVDQGPPDVPVLTKPYSITELEATIVMLGAQAAGTSSMTSSMDSNRG